MGVESEPDKAAGSAPAEHAYPPQPSADAMGYPVPIAYPQFQPSAGPSMGRAIDQATFFPAEETQPRFVGARSGHSSMLMRCGACGYVGPSTVRAVRGAAQWVFAACTLGIGLLLPLFWDTGHFCPQCSRQVAVAKIM